MPRLRRPHVPIEARCRVVLRQLGDMLADDTILWGKTAHGGLGAILDDRLGKLAVLLNCEVKELRLDHDPALAIRKKLYRTPNGGHVWSWEILKDAGEVVRYEPDANDPAHLRYRPHAAQHAGSHHVKTNIRGDGAQHPDRVLIKRLRRRTKAVSRKRRSTASKLPVRGFRSAVNKSKAKRKSAWPKGRKLQGRPFERKKR